jgi:hypothetical protein
VNFRLKERAREALVKALGFDRPLDALRFMELLLDEERQRIEGIAWSGTEPDGWVEVKARRNAIVELLEVVRLAEDKAAGRLVPAAALPRPKATTRNY